MFRSILVPLDGSPHAAAALPLARSMATATRSALHLLRVVPASQSAANEAASYLESIANELRSDGLSVDTMIGLGDAATEIVKVARAKEVDLIVMATHARGNRSILALTSVARRVLTESPSPVLLARPGGVRLHALRTLLVPVDGSPGGALALAAAIALARSTHARLVLLNVVVPVPINAFAALPATSLGVYIDPAWEDLARASAASYVDSMARRLTDVGVVAEGRVTTGEVAPEIVRVADEVESDLVVMSTHSIAWPGQAYLGSVADSVVANGQRPVLLVRREAPAGEVTAAASSSVRN
jgi:nucleotide-binding universal stress UspA family protein